MSAVRPWRLLFEGRSPGSRNMAVDGAVLRAVESGDSPPTVRLYGWEPYCVSLGYFQEPERELDAAAMEERDWDLVLRPTGGRAVLHAEEITYSVSARRGELPWCATLALSHARIGAAWAEALREFAPRLEEGAASGEGRKNGGPGLPCFASASRSELTHAGRKIVGSAQRRNREAFLQHGSIPLTARHELLVEVLRLDSVRRETYRNALRRHAVSLDEIRDLPEDLDGWSRRLAAAFCAALGIRIEEGGLTEGEEAYARVLEQVHLARQRRFFGSKQPAAAAV